MTKWMVSMKKADFDATAKKFGIKNITARLLRNRDLISDEQIESYLTGDASMLHDPMELEDIERGAGIMSDRIKAGARIRVIGDYDVDGICSSFILVKGLKLFGADVDCVLPDRVKDGYGLSIKLVDNAISDGIDTIITCDNGIAASEQIAHAKEKGMTVVVTDHHEVPFEEGEEGLARKELLPPADAVIDPKRAGGSCSFREICGAVVAYKFLQVMAKISGREEEEEFREFFSQMLVFAGIATVCDVMELRDENRIIVKESLRKIANTSNNGLKALINVNSLDASHMSAYHYGFVIGPCLNATGRLEQATMALDLFMEEDYGKAVKAAGDLKALNDSRKQMTQDGVKEAVKQVEELSAGGDLPKVLVLYLENTEESIAGIIAGRIKEKYYRPTIVITNAEGGGAKGSGRSIEKYDMFERLSEVKELFTKFGGHKMAAGLSLPKENIEVLRERLCENCGLSEEDFVPVLHIDMELPFAYADKELVKDMEKLEPFGNGNPKPVFARKNVKLLRGSLIGKNKNFGKYRVADGDLEMDMMYFGDLEKWHDFLRERYGQDKVDALYNGIRTDDPMSVCVAFYPGINDYNGSMQIIMSDFT
ncbi:single-stranded-DNA-specific exonuclease RecJ [Butyrivibrio sp. FCS014]|uniref:single-stranded-DNA-specific exonuclease RecJ n=1 Tax=Butyrivibrio sp. FCS014 TaxID=1408304 RepID=UPI0004641267|nr:single-stranded-DNA-specific exonuclease RecJ [Butyrivibrio sp. FCS014]